MTGGYPRRHLYYAEANAVSGHLSRRLDPIAQVFHVGEGDGQAKRDVLIDRDDIVQINFSAHTEVCGTFDAGRKVWTTIATATLKGLKVKQDDRLVVCADAIAATMTSEHDDKFYVPSVKFDLTIEGLLIDGELSAPTKLSAQGIFGTKPKDRFDPGRNRKDPNLHPYLVEYLEHPDFLASVKAQDKKIVDNPKSPDWAKRKFDRDQTHSSKIECSLVSDTGLKAHRAFGHIAEVENFGRIFLAELSVGDHFELNMLRLDMCDIGDGVSLVFAGPSNNGHPIP